MQKYLAIPLLLFCASCAQQNTGHHGYKFAKETNVYKGQFKSSVLKTMGTPTMVSGFNSNIWYYISVDTLSYPDQMPNKLTTTVLEIEFDGYYEVVDKVRKREGGGNIARTKYISPKNLDTYNIQSMLEKAAASLQPTVR